VNIYDFINEIYNVDTESIKANGTAIGCVTLPGLASGGPPVDEFCHAWKPVRPLADPGASQVRCGFCHPDSYRER